MMMMWALDVAEEIFERQVTRVCDVSSDGLDGREGLMTTRSRV
jgi:hypothetical protein